MLLWGGWYCNFYVFDIATSMCSNKCCTSVNLVHELSVFCIHCTEYIVQYIVLNILSRREAKENCTVVNFPWISWFMLVYVPCQSSSAELSLPLSVFLSDTLASSLRLLHVPRTITELNIHGTLDNWTRTHLLGCILSRSKHLSIF